MKKQIILLVTGVSLLTACGGEYVTTDASGTFEATEIIVSAEAQGKILELNLQEGDHLSMGQYVGLIDTVQLQLKKLQLLAAVRGIKARRPNVNIQLSSLKDQLAKAETEQARVEKLYADGAATQKQVDDVKVQVDVLRSSIAAQNNYLGTSVAGLNEESNVYDIQVAQVNDLLARSYIHNPIDGTVLNKYVEVNELAAPGTPLYKIADIENMFLRVYVVSGQLDKLKIGQKVNVSIALSDGKNKEYEGVIAWIADKAEFSPKTIQTQDERQNLVYAVKIAVKNTDGALKIGMYGDVKF